MRDLFLDALKRKYEAEIAAGKATAKVYFDKAFEYVGLLKSTEVESLLSKELITSNNRAASLTFLVIGPAWSKDDANATIPYLEQLPYVGFKPTVPVKDAGCLMEPPVSVPIVVGVNYAAKADADPPEEPPGTKFLSIGLITLPK